MERVKRDGVLIVIIFIIVNNFRRRKEKRVDDGASTPRFSLHHREKIVVVFVVVVVTVASLRFLVRFFLYASLSRFISLSLFLSREFARVSARGVFCNCV